MDTAPPLQIETPEGAIIEPAWTETGPGVFTAEAPVDQLGLYRARAGGLEAVALNGPANPKEYADLQSTIKVMQPLARATGGGVFRLNADGSGLPDIRRSGQRACLREATGWACASAVPMPYAPPPARPCCRGIVVAALLVLLLLLAWRREGR